MFLTNFVKTTENLLYVGDYDFPHHDVLLLLSVFDHFLQSPHLKTNNDQHLISSPLTRYGEARVDTFFFFLCKHLVTIFFFRIKKKIKKKKICFLQFFLVQFSCYLQLFLFLKITFPLERNRIGYEKKKKITYSLGGEGLVFLEVNKQGGQEKKKIVFLFFYLISICQLIEKSPLLMIRL